MERKIAPVMQHLPWRSARRLAVIEQHFSVYHGIVDPVREHAHPPPVIREVMDDFLFSRPHGVRIEYDHVSRQTRP